MHGVGENFDCEVLRLVEIDLLRASKNSVYGTNLVDQRSGETHRDMISTRSVQAFMDRYRIVQRRQSGNLKMSPEKKLELQIETARYLANLKKGFEYGDLKEEDVNNSDETHF